MSRRGCHLGPAPQEVGVVAQLEQQVPGSPRKGSEQAVGEAVAELVSSGCLALLIGPRPEFEPALLELATRLPQLGLDITFALEPEANADEEGHGQQGDERAVDEHGSSREEAEAG